MAGLISSLLTYRTASVPQNQVATSSAGAAWLSTFFGGGSLADAESLPAVYACVRVISNAISVLPISVHKGDREDISERATNHPLHRLLNVKPNAWQTPAEFKKQLQRSALLRGNGYALKIFEGAYLDSLIPLDADRVVPFWYATGKHAYKYTPANGAEQIIMPHEMFHLRGASKDGLTGDSVLDVLRQSFEHTQSMRDHSHNTFKNGGTPRGALSMPAGLKDESFERLKKQFNDTYMGSSNAGKTLVLEEGMKFEPISLSLGDVQLLESYKLSRSEIASAFGVPLHKINDLDKSSFNNIEHQSLEFYTDTLLPWITLWEETIARDLILYPDTYFASFNVDALLRADSKSRATYNKEMVYMGAKTRNEVRKDENLPPLDGLDEPILPLNLATTDKTENSDEK